MATVTICSDFGAPQKIKSDTVCTVSPSISHEVMGPDAMILESHYFMANRRGKIESSDNFLFLGSKITVDDDCSHEIKSFLLFERKAMTNLESIFKSRDITLPTKVCIVKAMFFQ